MNFTADPPCGVALHSGVSAPKTWISSVQVALAAPLVAVSVAR